MAAGADKDEVSQKDFLVSFAIYVDKPENRNVGASEGGSSEEMASTDQNSQSASDATGVTASSSPDAPNSDAHQLRFQLLTDNGD